MMYVVVMRATLEVVRAVWLAKFTVSHSWWGHRQRLAVSHVDLFWLLSFRVLANDGAVNVGFAPRRSFSAAAFDGDGKYSSVDLALAFELF